ncbi:hypothetical protein Zmor_022140 [Zophobas morio]|uniref:CRAL-TRIO domain-containing protein n=1 Tax=Zophobas morio TaxID=2755281 RepID=A0AA38M5N3_9CUCU|nr:hypothetical protein Zmor_022140 [Zophobas morio]
MFHIDAAVKKTVYQMFDRTEEMVNEDVHTVKKWMETQPHLPEIMDETMIRNFLNLNKFSIEKTKVKIDMYYTMRSLIPELYAISNPKLERMQRALDNIYVCTHPTPLEGTHRVHFIKWKESNAFFAEEYTMLFFDVLEVRLHEDFMVNDVVIVDFENVSLTDMKQLTPSLIYKQVSVYQKVFSLRWKSAYIVNSPPYMTVLMAFVKTVMKPKMFERMHVVADSKILSEVFSEEELPKDYGGQGPSLQELTDMMRHKFAEHQDRFDALDKLTVDESRRPKKLSNDDVLGFHGNFRKLDVD